MKNHLIARAALAALAATALAGLSACDRGGDTGAAKRTSATTHADTAGTKTTASNDNGKAPGLLIGTPPAPPTGDPPGTTPVAKDTTNISKQSEVNSMPHEGDNHAYSSVATDNPQKATKVDAQQTPERTNQ